MAKDYITILNRLPARIHLKDENNIDIFVYLNIVVSTNSFNDKVFFIAYLNCENDYPVIYTDSYRAFEEVLDDIVDKLSKYIDINDILQP